MTTNTEKIRPDDVLGNLTEAQQNTILDWCETLSFRAVVDRIAAPARDGMGVQVHLQRSHLDGLHAEDMI